MNGVAAVEQRQQLATSPADWARAPLRSGLSSAGSLASQAEIPTSKTNPGRDIPILSKTLPFLGERATVEELVELVYSSTRVWQRTPTLLNDLLPNRTSANEKMWSNASENAWEGERRILNGYPQYQRPRALFRALRKTRLSKRHATCINAISGFELEWVARP
ncbi:hypothetical protein RB195_022369 [Necator americanus]|uniref:Uncharacterized protein n=1 Tax=Necator americanus TaxID=51031 RepID=A0ABR1EF17_NECAM